MSGRGYRESKEKRAARPRFYLTPGAHPILGMLPPEIAAFYARVTAARERALAREAEATRLLRVKTLRPRTLYAGNPCRPLLP